MLGEIKDVESKVNDMLEKLRNLGTDIDQRAVALARTQFETGFMWAVRSIFIKEMK